MVVHWYKHCIYHFHINGYHTPFKNDTSIYIQTIFAGTIASVLYNHTASVLRALGDSKHPFYFLLCSCVVNVLLDVLFVAGLQLGVFGAAFATVISQLLSGLLNLWWLYRHMEYFSICKAHMKLSPKHIRRLCVVGLPMGFEYSVSAIGAVVMQNAINTLGSVAIAAQTAGEKIRQMFTLPMESVGMAVATYAAQNYGARKFERIRTGIRDGLWIQYGYCIVVWIVIFFSKAGLVGIVLGENTSATAAGAIEYLSRMSMLFFIHGSLMIFRNNLQGMGYSMQAIISGIGELIGRCFGSYLAVYTELGFVGICYSNPIAWGFALLYCIFMVAYHLRQDEKGK